MRINVSLSFVRDSECPLKLRRSRLRSVRNRVRATRRIPSDFIAIGGQFAGQCFVAAQNFRVRGAKSCVRHRGGRLRRRLVGVARCAFRVADQLRPVRHVLRWPPSGRRNSVFRGFRNFVLAGLTQNTGGECGGHSEYCHPAGETSRGSHLGIGRKDYASDQAVML